MTPADFIAAAKVPASIPSGTWGLWTIRRVCVPEDSPERARVGHPVLTSLHKVTEATLNTEFGDVIMEDSAIELRKHLPIWMAARGRVLVSGLGLGCVVRGLLLKPEVETVTVVEIDPTILRIVGPEFERHPKVRLVRGDALTYHWPEQVRWDFAWHDLYTDEGNGVALHCLHLKLMARLRDRVCRQGAWALPRMAKRFLPEMLG